MKPKILIVDDLEETRFAARAILRRNGDYEFFEAENGQEGVEIAFKELPHLILMDALMPVMDGFEAIAILRNDPRTNEIPILMVSALTTHDEKVKALTSGISDFIAKPFDKTELVIRVNSQLNLYLNYLRKEEELSQLNNLLERKVEERTRALQIKERYTRAILDSTPDLICVFNSVGEISDTNQAWCDFFAPLSLESPLQNNFSFLIPFTPKLNDIHFLNAYNPSQWFAMLLGSKERSYKLKVIRENRYYLFSMSARNMLHHDDQFMDRRNSEERYLVILNDISEFERIREEREGQIKLASIGKLAAGITHEINTPLTYIKGNVELMRMELDTLTDSPSKSELLENMESIEEGLRRIGNIIDATREFTKKGSGNKEVSNVFSTLVYAARMVYNRTKHLAPIYVNGVVFDLDLACDAYTYDVLAIKEKLEQVWIIILNNASDEFLNCEKSFDQRWIKINIALNGGSIEIAFHDNARGIDESILPTIFEPFVSSKTYSGMGIGLNIAQSIVHEHGGTIRAYNDDEGAVFTVTLPLYRSGS